MKVGYDVAIIGGGPAGCSAAIELARSGRRVIVLERSAYDDVRVGETVPPQALPWLRRLGIPDAFASVPHLPAPGVVRVWESSFPLADPLCFETDRHGWHVDRPRLDALLADTARQAGAIVRCRAVARAARRQRDGGWQVQFDRDYQRADVEAHWLIDATGRRSWLRRHVRGQPRLADGLVGLLGYGGPRTSDDRDLFVEATPTGWWYSAPLPGGRSVAAFMTDGDLLPREDLSAYWEQQRSRTALIAQLHRPLSSLRVVAARTVWSETVAAGRWLAVGDAAMALDPLFGLGICQSLASGYTCARALLEAPTDDGVTRTYRAWCDLQYRDYLQRRRRIYGSVRRWLHAPFWQRRSSQSSPQSVIGNIPRSAFNDR